MNRDHPNYSIVKIGQNTEESPEDFKLAVTQTPEKNHQLTLVWGIHKAYNNSDNNNNSSCSRSSSNNNKNNRTKS